MYCMSLVTLWRSSRFDPAAHCYIMHQQKNEANYCGRKVLNFRVMNLVVITTSEWDPFKPYDNQYFQLYASM